MSKRAVLIWVVVTIWVSIIVSVSPGLASVFYDYKKMAATGESEVLAIQAGISINDKGRVAFQAQNTDGIDNVYYSNGSGPVRVSNNSSVTLSMNGGVQINNNNKIIGRTRQASAKGPISRLQVWDSNDVVLSFGTQLGICGADFPPCLSILLNPSLSDNDLFAANLSFSFSVNPIFVCRDFSCIVGGAGGFGAGQFKAPMIATSGDYVIRNGDTETHPVTVFRTASPAEVQIAFTGIGWTALGAKPGISDDGPVVAFAGNRGSGPGIFASIQWGPNYTDRITVRVAGEGLTPGFPDLGADRLGAPRYFSDVSVDERVGVIRHPAKPGDPIGLKETIVVSFMAKPNNASPPQSYLSGLIFTDQQGLWTRRIDVVEYDSSKPLLPNEVVIPGPFKVVYHYPIPVVQVGEKIKVGAEEWLVEAISIYDPISADAIGREDSSPQRPGDHFVAFLAQSGIKQVVIRADHQSASILFVPRLGQSFDGSNVEADPVIDWATKNLDHYFDTFPPTTIVDPINMFGCVLTSVAMQLNFAAQKSGLNVVTDPGLLNDTLKVVSGVFKYNTSSLGIITGTGLLNSSVDAVSTYRNNILIPLAPSSDKVKGIIFSKKTINSFTHPSAAKAYLIEQLNDMDRPIQLRVEGSSAALGHTVLVTGTVNDRFIIVDPAHRDRLSLSDPAYNKKEYATSGVIIDPPDTSTVTFSVGENADIQVVDTMGRMTGAGVNGIPGSDYSVDITDDEATGSSRILGPNHVVSILQPPVDQYTIVVKGLQNGPFTLDIVVFDKVGTYQKSMQLTGTATIGLTQTLQAKVDTTPGGNSQLIPPVLVTGDLDGDSDIDKIDIGIILAAKGTAASGPNDPRDVDKDGQITILDARKLATMCTRLNCAP